MKKRLAIVLCSVLLLATAGCHFNRLGHHSGHPQGMAPGQAKKIVHPDHVQIKVKGPKHKHHGKPWK